MLNILISLSMFFFAHNIQTAARIEADDEFENGDEFGDYAIVLSDKERWAIEKSGLIDKNDNLTAALNKSKKDAEDYQSDLTIKNSLIEQLKKSIGQLQERLNTKTDEIETLRDKYLESTKSLKDLNISIQDERQNFYRVVNAKDAELNEHIKRVKELTATLDIEIEKYTAQIAQRKEDHDLAEISMANKIRLLEQKERQVRTELDLKILAITHLEEDIRQLKTSACERESSLNTEITKLRQDLSDARKQISRNLNISKGLIEDEALNSKLLVAIKEKNKKEELMNVENRKKIAALQRMIKDLQEKNSYIAYRKNLQIIECPMIGK